MNLREIDRLVAEKVMGWEPEEIEGSAYLSGYVLYKREEPPHIPDYQFKPSTNVADAWKVVEKLREKELYVDIDTFAEHYDVRVVSGPNEVGHSLSETAPLAICLAALKAAGVEVEGMDNEQ
ncbi:hypothetical protein H839_08099 [Parageobacillus genomosp. 1]|uniref:Phage ABA sandwich domain-containing protein n=1 Tax=Parageobacillus genomosp. 1 TaxID=1295642 RepID=A0ABC9VGE7_9BACL|nr:hypothetical protein [Parageobacillus genomosp. 1]EZP77579.1 hypothetical protein H839_08099 [Parageobacillus genomosp. 1]